MNLHALSSGRHRPAAERRFSRQVSAADAEAIAAAMLERATELKAVASAVGASGAGGADKGKGKGDTGKGDKGKGDNGKGGGKMAEAVDTDEDFSGAEGLGAQVGQWIRLSLP